MVGRPKKPYTVDMVRALGAALVLMMVTTTARGDDLPRPPSAAGPAAQPVNVTPASASASDEERAFSAELERFAQRRAFTEQLIAKREAEAFEQATLRQARIAKLTRELTEREAAMSEREFEEAVMLYLKKRELTRELAARTKAAATGSASTPGATPSSTP
jgi:crotonobetainyl-CoA:carnitine CoA-transferase CaiB-like acyl-CoA transferase